MSLCNPMDYSMPGLPVPHHFLKFAQIHVHCINDAIQPSHLLTPLFSFCPQYFPASKTFPMTQLPTLGDQNTGASASPSVLPVSIQGWFSLRLTWFDLLAVQGTLMSLLQHQSSKASILWFSAFFMVQLSQLYLTTEKTIAFTIWTFVGRVMFLLFNILSRFVIAFLPRSNCILISWLESSSTVILEPKKRRLSLLPLFPLLFAMK